jgi:NAD(P)-dependent dehydrogenase (short-subunit alcohol dehydrogenase family)
MNKVWFITGAGRGMGVDFTKAALAAGFVVVATGRNTDAVTKAVGKSNDLLVVKLDVTRPSEADTAARAAVERFGRIDVLLNSAGNFYAGYPRLSATRSLSRPNSVLTLKQEVLTADRSTSGK